MKWVLIAAAAITLEFATAWGLGRFIRAGTREMPPAPGDQSPPDMVPAPGPDDPPEYDPWEPGDDGVFADARAEMDQWWAEQEDDDEF